MIATFRTLFRSQDLLWSWTHRIIQARYQQSVLGGLWMIIQPAATVTIFTIIFTRFIPVETGGIPYAVFSYVAIIPWAFLSSSLTDMTSSLVQNMSLVTKIYFPRETLPLAGMLARLLDFAIAVILLVVLLLVYQIPPFPSGWVYIPVILLIQIGLVMGLGLMLAALNVFYRDVQSFLTLGIQLWFYASPIIYPVELVPSQWRSIYSLNPMVGILESYRAVILYQSAPPALPLVFAGLEAFFLLVVGYILFKRLELVFADIV